MVINFLSAYGRWELPDKKTKPRFSARPDHRPAEHPLRVPPAVEPRANHSLSTPKLRNPAPESDVPTQRTGSPAGSRSTPSPRRPEAGESGEPGSSGPRKSTCAVSMAPDSGIQS